MKQQKKPRQKQYRKTRARLRIAALTHIRTCLKGGMKITIPIEPWKMGEEMKGGA